MNYFSKPLPCLVVTKKTVADNQKYSNPISANQCCQTPHNPHWWISICRYKQIQSNAIYMCKLDRTKGKKYLKPTNFAFWNFSTIICFLSDISCTEWGTNNLVIIGCIIHQLIPGTICAFWCQGLRPKMEWNINEFVFGGC